jgi:DnaJ homolog subfamily C member 7
LGEAEKALNCVKETPYFDSELAVQAQALQVHFNKCTEARKVKDWKVILKETQSAISLGVDSAPKVSFLGQMFYFSTPTFFNHMGFVLLYPTH